MGDLDPPPAGQIPVEVELLLQLQGLVPGVGLTAPLSGWICGGEDAPVLYHLQKVFCFFFFLPCMRNMILHEALIKVSLAIKEIYLE